MEKYTDDLHSLSYTKWKWNSKTLLKEPRGNTCHRSHLRRKS